ncbi:superoxide dismutase [Candidatus Roizmanbacteria bacterium]|nr:superoxide dismutase [Candidatus Roizmanbacteria bacterium]
METSKQIIQPRTPMTFSGTLNLMQGISSKAVEEHLKLYEGYVKKYNELREKLSQLTDEDYAGANATYSLIRELKVELSFAWGGVVNHELYFSHLGGIGGSPSENLLTQIETDFGSFDRYKKDMKASGISARGWVWTVWNTQEKRLFNYIGDSQNTFPIWYGTPIVALDTYEHAYFMDFGVNRGSYIDVFFENISWDVVGQTFVGIKK